MVSTQARAWPSEAGLGPGWGLPEPGARIAGGLPKLLLELKVRLPVEFKQLLEAGVEVLVLLL